MLTGELGKSFGDKVEVRYFNTDKDGIKNYPSVEQVIAHGYSFPIININNQPRLAGGVNTEKIKEMINELME